MSDYPPVVQATKYHVNCVPEEVDSHYMWGIDVEHRGGDRWAITRHRNCLSRAGDWDYESIPSERTDEWLTDHRFGLAEALELAKQHAPLTRVNRYTATDVIEQELLRRKPPVSS